MDFSDVREFAAKSVPLVNVARARIETSAEDEPGKWVVDFIRRIVMSEFALPLKEAQQVAEHAVQRALQEIYEDTLNEEKS